MESHLEKVKARPKFLFLSFSVGIGKKKESFFSSSNLHLEVGYVNTSASPPLNVNSNAKLMFNFFIIGKKPKDV